MELKSILEAMKLEKGRDNLQALTLSILKGEEMLIENHANTEGIINSFKSILMDAFAFIKENKIEINDSKVNDLDLDYWKNNIGLYKTKNPDMTKDVYLYSIRNSLKYLLDTRKDKTLQKAHIFEIVIKTFLFIDFINFSIDSVLKSNEVIVKSEPIEVKKTPKIEDKKIAEN
jgi:hypothetical protein